MACCGRLAVYKAKESYSIWGGSDLRSKRSELGMTQVALARALGISHRMYCYYENGEQDIPRSVELSTKYLVREKSGDDQGTLEPTGTLTAFDRERISRLCLAIEGHEAGDADTDRLLRQSLTELDYLLSKFPE